MTKKIWFVRHAESVTNAGGVWLDQYTNPLTERGHQQAVIASKALPEEPSLIVTSPFLRTKETAKPTLVRWPNARHEEWPVQEYCAICSARRGILSEEEKNEIYRTVYADPDYKDGEFAESFNSMINRVDTTIERILRKTDERIVIFSHGYFLGALFYRLNNRDRTSVSIDEIREYNRLKSIPNTAIIHYRFRAAQDIEFLSASTDHLPGEICSI